MNTEQPRRKETQKITRDDLLPQSSFAGYGILKASPGCYGRKGDQLGNKKERLEISNHYQIFFFNSMMGLNNGVGGVENKVRGRVNRSKGYLPEGQIEKMGAWLIEKENRVNTYLKINTNLSVCT